MKSRLRSILPWHLVGTLVLLATTLTASKLTARRRTDALAQPLDDIGREIRGFVGSENPLSAMAYLACATVYELSVAYLRQAKRSRRPLYRLLCSATSWREHALSETLSSGWRLGDLGLRQDGHPGGGRSFEVNKYSIENGGDRKLVLYWYQSKGRIIASEYMGKLLLARDALMQNSTAASIVRIIVPDQPGALESARGFASELIPQVQHSFGE